MKKLLTLLLALSLLLLAGCGPKTPEAPGNEGEDETPKTPITLTVGASITPHAEVLEAARPAFEAKGYTLVIREFTDYVQPNLTLDSGDIDANYFQHYPYLDWFNEEYGTDIVAVGEVHYEAFGIYPGKSSDLEQIAQGAVFGIPNDGTNEARALLLMEQCGLIKLREGIALSATVLDIDENPHGLVIREMEAAQIPLSLQDLDFGVINFNFAYQAGLKASTDALVVEDADSVAAETYSNVVCVKAGNEQNEAVLALIEALQTEEVRDFILTTYGGAVLPRF
ncbi:MAG: ABC transporter substrate-binding protein [Clostridiales bacterium]|nr:ABC transporter substrate-binding protein [Clostridiales bacterium]